MAGVALSYLTRPLALAAVIAALIGYRTMLVRERDAAKARAAQMAAQLNECEAGADALKRAIDERNAAVSRMERKAEQAAAAAQSRTNAAAARAEAALNKAVARANAIRNAPVPKGCEGAIEWGNGEGPELGQW